MYRTGLKNPNKAFGTPNSATNVNTGINFFPLFNYGSGGYSKVVGAFGGALNLCNDKQLFFSDIKYTSKATRGQ